MATWRARHSSDVADYASPRRDDQPRLRPYAGEAPRASPSAALRPAVGDHRRVVRRRLARLPRQPQAGAGQRGAVQRQYLASALVLAAGEDKANPGAFIASPSMPWVWGDEVKDLSSPSASYHEVWSRDVYQIGTALYAMGDVAAAQRAVGWLFRTQQKPDGSFPQNSDVDGTRGVDRDPARPGHAADRARPPGRPDRQADLPRHQEGGPLPDDGSATRRPAGRRRSRRRSAGRTSPATRPPPSPPRSTAWSPARRSRGSTATRSSPRRGRRPPTAGHARSRAGRSRPTARSATRRTSCASPRTASPTRARRTPSATAARPARTSAASSTRASSTWCASASCPPTTRSCSTAWPWSTRTSPCRPRTAPSGTASASTGTARRAPAASGTITDDGDRKTLGRAWPLLAGERGEYAVAAGAERSVVPGQHGRRGQRLGHDRRAGLGRPRTHRPGVLPGG